MKKKTGSKSRKNFSKMRRDKSYPKTVAVSRSRVDTITPQLADIIDVKALQSMMDNLYAFTQVGFALIDLKGKVLAGTGWQDICTKFHRVNRKTLKNCLESDLILTRGVKRGEFRSYKCKNHIWDIVTPLFIGKEHVGNIFTGQFFYEDEPVDYGSFARQAEKYGFDKGAYLDALRRVPRLNRQKIRELMKFYVGLAGTISRLGLGNLIQKQLITEQQQSEEALRESERRLNKSQEIAHLGSWELEVVNNRLSWSDEVYRIFGLNPQEFKATYEAFLEAVHPDDRKSVDAAYSDSLREGKDTYEIEHRVIKKDTGEIRFVHEKCEHIRNKEGKIVKSIGMVHDVTEQKRAQKKINHLASFPQSNPNPVIEVNIQGKIIFANLATLRILKSLGAAKQIRLFLPKDFKRILKNLQSKGAGPCEAEIKIKNTIFIETISLLSEYKAVRIYARDITKRTMMEEGLRWNRQRDSMLSDFASALLASSDPLAIIQHIGQSAMEFLNCKVFFNFLVDTKDKNLRLNAYSGIPERDAKRIERLDHGAAECDCVARGGKTIIIEGILNKKDPRMDFVRGYGIRAYCCHPLLVRDGVIGTISFGTTGRDTFTEDEIFTMKATADIVSIAMQRKRVEDAQHQSAARLRANIELTGQIAWTTDARGNVVEDIPTWRKFTGQNTEEIKGLGWSNAIHPDDFDRVLKAWKMAVRYKSKYEIEFRVRGRDGTYRYFLTRSTPFLDKDGRLHEWQGVCIDITERKLMEEELVKVNDKLEAKVQERTQDLNRANKWLGQEILKRKEIESKLRLRGAVLKLQGNTPSRREFVDRIVKLLKGISGCSCAGIRILSQGGYIPYDSYIGFSREFWKSESPLSLKTDQCVCTRVIAGKPARCDAEAMSEAGSFFCNNTFAYIRGLSEEDKNNFRGVCVRSGFASLALIPIRYKRSVIGAIHLADEETGKLPLKKIELIESIAPAIGEGIHEFDLEESIRREHLTLDAFFNHAINPLVFLDRDFNFMRVNNAYAKACQKDGSEFLGHNHFKFYPHAENEAIFKRVVETKTPAQFMAKPFVFPEHPEWGVTYWDWSLVPVLNKEGEVDFLVFSLIDVTEHKRAEEKLIESEKALQTAKRLSDIGGLAATVAHELRNPLGVIHAAAYNIKRKAKNPLIEGHLSNIEKKTREADQIINNLLFYARLRLPQFQPLNLYDTILECIETSRARFKGQRIIFKKNMRAVKKTLIEVDPVQIKEVFTNILNNAFEASLEQKGKIIVNASPDGPGNIRVSVRDSGPGIKEEYMERLFEPFFTTKTRGTGLGLAVCKQIVLLHSGKIDIESQEGKGTHVTVILPKTQTTSRIETDA